MRNFFAVLSGGLFGTGLMISGMTDPRRTQGWLDIFGNWDPTLAFVMGGAVAVMLVAWAVAGRRAEHALGGNFPAAPEPQLGRNLVIGSTLFGAGWGLAGLCPGPAMASLSWGGTGGMVFLVAMGLGMFAAPPIKSRLETPTTA